MSNKKHIYLSPYVCNERIFDGLQLGLNKKKIEQKINEFCSLFDNASFGTFCIQIGQLLESQWVF